MATIECKLAMCINRLVEFELLLELKIEQKKGTSLVEPVLLRRKSGLQIECLSLPVIYLGYRPGFHSDLALITAFMLWPSINGHLLGVYFFGGISPSKIGHIAPFLATIQALSKTRVFLLSKKKRRLLCMGRTFTANKPLPLI
jgi:hypothetical protein